MNDMTGLDDDENDTRRLFGIWEYSQFCFFGVIGALF